MDLNNKTILIAGLVICSLVAMYFSYKDIALTIVAGLVGYLSRDMVSVDPQVVPVDPTSVSVDPTSVSVDPQVESVDLPSEENIDEDVA